MKIYNFSHAIIHFVHICEGAYQVVYQFPIDNYNKYWYFDKNIVYNADYLVELIKSLPYIKNSKIIDNGPDISPRYEIEAPFNDNDNIPGVPRPGHYYIDLFTPNGAIRSFSEQIRLIEMKCSSVSENFDSEIDHFVWLH